MPAGRKHRVKLFLRRARTHDTSSFRVADSSERAGGRIAGPKDGGGPLPTDLPRYFDERVIEKP